MNANGRIRAMAGRWVVASGLLVLAGLARAEVGVSVGPDDGVQEADLRLYVMRIVDDPDPWPTVSAQPGNRVALNPEGSANGDGKPALLHNTVSGLPVVAWARSSPAGFDVVVSHFDGSAWTEPDVVAGAPADEVDPSLALDPSDGTVHLFYVEQGPDATVLHRSAPADLSSWSPAEPVSLPGQIAFRPAGVVHDGVLRVAYEVHPYGPEQTPREIVLSRREPEGFVEEIVATTNHDAPLWPRAHSHSGRMWVDWIDSSTSFAWTRLGAGGWEPLRYEPYADVEERDFLVREAIRIRVVRDP